MSAASNETEEGVDYTYDDGPDRPVRRGSRGLGPGQRKRLRVAGSTFNIRFYRRGRGRGRRRVRGRERKELLATARDVAKGSLVRLLRTGRGDWKVKVVPAQRVA